jgi:hypothetical protein
MSFGRGLTRLWIVGSILWVAYVIHDKYSGCMRPWSPRGTPLGWADDICFSDGGLYRASTVTDALAVPIVTLVIGLVAWWVLRAFAKPDVRDDQGG